MKRITGLTLSTFSALALTTLSAAPVFYVSPQGSDTWSGERSSSNSRKTDGPFATLPRALRAARDSKVQSTSAEGKVPQIVMRGGTYFLTEPIIFTSADSGVSISAFKSEQPVLSGGRQITGWRTAQINGQSVWTVDLPDVQAGKWYFHELWVNGTRATRARHPNQGYLKVAELPDTTTNWFQGNQRFRFSEGDLKNWPDITEAEVVVMNRWVESRLPVKSIDAQQRIAAFGKRSVFQLAAGDLYYLEGAIEALDEPGEWCLDRTQGKLYYLPRPGERLEQTEAIAPALVQVLRLEGQSEQLKFVEHVRFKGVTFSHTEWCFPSGFATTKGAPVIEPAPDPDVGGFGQAAIGVPGAVWGQGVRNCVFENCRFLDLGTYGLELGRGCVSNRVSRCEFADLSAGGIKLGETAIRSQRGEMAEANEVSDCSIHDGGKMFHSAIGIWIGQSPNNRLEHNLIHDFYYTAISIGWTWGYGAALATNNFVAYNHVHHIGVKSKGDGPILSDMGGIYTLGMQPGTRIFNNLWHDIAGLQYGGWGIYFDEGSSSIVARSNIVYRTTHGGFHQHYGATNSVQNNILAFARDHQLQRSRPEPHVSFSLVTNIVYFDHGVLLGSSWGDDQFVLDWNLYWDARTGADSFDSVPTFGGAPLDKWRGRGHDLHSLIADPLFTAPEQYNFKLNKKSPAFKLGFLPFDLSQVGPRKK